MRITLLIAALLLTSACNQSTATVKQANTAVAPTPAASPSAMEMASERDAAITRFIDSKYKGWKLEGTDNDDGCQDGAECTIHIKKESNDKVVVIVARMFHRPDGKLYWFVYEPSRIELASLRLGELKKGVQLTERADTLSKLQPDDCVDVMADTTYENQ